LALFQCSEIGELEPLQIIEVVGVFDAKWFAAHLMLNFGLMYCLRYRNGEILAVASSSGTVEFYQLDRSSSNDDVNCLFHFTPFSMETSVNVET
jgi:hypothetical protein